MKVVSDKHIRTRKKYTSKNESASNKILLFMLIFFVISTYFVLGNSISKASNSIDDVTVMVQPIQINSFMPISFIEMKNGVEVTLTKVADYKIAGRVVESYDYTSSIANIIEMMAGKTYYNDIAIKDVAIAYGPMALEENHKKMTYVMAGSRRISYAVSDKSLYEDLGELATVKRYITNNHLIPANSDVEKLIKKIEKDDYVQISGYLVNAVWDQGIYKYALETSMDREDTGAGACEVIYVTDVKWIK